MFKIDKVVLAQIHYIVFIYVLFVDKIYLPVVKNPKAAIMNSVI
jgi:hypothetical protein